MKNLLSKRLQTYNTPSVSANSSLQAKLVKQEQQAIDAQYEKKLKGAEVAQKM